MMTTILGLCLLDLIKDPLTHMVRNSADHGLETPAERLASGKGEQGTIRLSAYHEGGHIIICIADNGRGLNTEKIKAKALSSGLVLDLIKDPLTHMVRNSADHGLETPAERLASGKGEQGTIRLSAYHEGGHIIICIADNGRGLNTEKIKAKALSSGLESLLVEAKTAGIDRSKIQADITQIQQQMKNTADAATFNGVNWLSATASTPATFDLVSSFSRVQSTPTIGSITLTISYR
ncbi:hypothetical protein FOM02_45995 [Bradyrhizobium sp. SEMIA]|nr:hypothetical protein FOM02_45995 [Bradyrhizobium sp. SEMIA]